jgi:hypothetical protein
MKMRISILRLLNPILFSLFIYNCSEDPLVSNLDHSGLTINTLTIDNISAQNYSVAPNLGTNESLYLGTKNGLNIPVSFIEIANNAFWSYGFDSTILIDSLHFITYSKDSLLLQNSTPNLFFSPDSQFDENTSTYLDFSTFSNLDWVDLDQPLLKTNNDTSGYYLYTELIWGIDTLMESLIDTSDSNLVRSFALQFTNNDSNYIELFSEEATTGEKDPKIIMYYRKTIESGDSTIIDTTSATIYSNGDLSIIDPGEITLSPDVIGLSNGKGLRSIINIPLTEDSLPAGSVIRSAELILNYDTTITNQTYNVVLDPIDNDSLALDSNFVYEFDPYEAMGYPYRVSTDTEDGKCILSVKEIMQNISLGNVTNLGFKLISNEKNDPFETIWFDTGESTTSARLEIIYVTN